MFHLAHFISHLFTFKILAKITPITHLARLKIPAELASTANVPEDMSLVKLIQSLLLPNPQRSLSSRSYTHIPPLHLFLFLVLFIALIVYLSLHFSLLVTTLWITIILAVTYLWICKYYEPIYLQNQKEIETKMRFLDQIVGTL